MPGQGSKVAAAQGRALAARGRGAGGEGKGGKTWTLGAAPRKLGAQMALPSPQRPLLLAWPWSHLAALAWHIIFCFIRLCSILSFLCCFRL